MARRMAQIAMALMLLFGLAAAPCAAQDWPPDAQARMSAAGERLKAAASVEERVAALREIEAVAQAHPDAPDARLMANLLAQKATQEAGPGKMLAALETLAASGQVTDAQTLGSIAAPLMSSIAEMQENGTLLPEAALQLDAVIKQIDAAAARAGLPSLAEAVDAALGDTGAAGKVRGALGKIAAAADLARRSQNLDRLDRDAKKQYLDDIVGFLPPGAGPAINGPAFVVFRDTLVWNSDMYGEATKGLDLVSDAIETGQFDHEAYGRVKQRLEELSKGPWGSDTAKDFFKKLCEKIPVAGAWCGDAFEVAERLFGGGCEAIDCDCQNVGGGLMRGPLIVQCEIQQADLAAACKQAGKITGSCGDAAGPGANPR